MDNELAYAVEYLNLEKRLNLIKFGETKYTRILDVVIDALDKKPKGRQVKYIKCEVLDKIRAEIAKRTIEQGFHADEWSISYDELMKIIDKYKGESEDK